MTPSAATGLEDGRNSFVKVLQKNNVTKWIQTVEGIPVYGSVLTTHNDEEGEPLAYYIHSWVICCISLF